MEFQQFIYLDNAATTKVDNEVIEASLPYLSEFYGNASSSHLLGLKVNNDIKIARSKVARLLNATEKEIVFTSGATESINTILKGIVNSSKSGRNQIVTTVTEHAAVLETCKNLEMQGVDVIYLSVDKDGFVDLNALKSIINEKTLLVSILYVNNETGVIQPIKEIIKIAHENGAYMMSDVVQAIGKIEIDVQDLDIDFLVFSGHKFHAPKGIGGHYINRRIKNLLPLIYGGGQEKGRRSGTLNVPGIIGIGKASEIALTEMSKNKSVIIHLRDLLEQELLKIENTFVNGNLESRLYSITNICFPKTEAEIMIKMLGNICVSNGSACHSELIEPSHVLKAMGLSDEDAFSSIRFSLSKYNTEENIIYVVERVKEIVSKLTSAKYV